MQTNILDGFPPKGYDLRAKEGQIFITDLFMSVREKRSLNQQA
jgi:hypothetical protein